VVVVVEVDEVVAVRRRAIWGPPGHSGRICEQALSRHSPGAVRTHAPALDLLLAAVAVVGVMVVLVVLVVVEVMLRGGRERRSCGAEMSCVS
jgi:hypothetical protein